MAALCSWRTCRSAFLGALSFFFVVGPGAGTAAGAEPPASFKAKRKSGDELSFYGLGSGRFEVAALVGPEGARLGELAEQAWGAWRVAFGLPERWPVGITVRLAPPAGWPAGSSPWRVASDPGGIVSLWVRQSTGVVGAWAEARLQMAALATAAMQRQAIFIGVPAQKVTTPAWLAAAAAEAAVVREQASLSDAWLLEASSLTRVPALKSVLGWQSSGEAVPGEVRMAAYGAWIWLQAEGTRSGAWRRFLAEVLGGGDAMAALARNYGGIPGRGSAQELELAWQTAFAQIARVKNVPVLEAFETRRWLEQVDRVVLLEADGSEQVYQMVDMWPRRKVASLREQLEARSTLLAANLRTMHPFYSNAAVSWGKACQAILAGKESAWKKAHAEWRQDLETGRSLEEASRIILGRPDGSAAP